MERTGGPDEKQIKI